MARAGERRARSAASPRARGLHAGRPLRRCGRPSRLAQQDLAVAQRPDRAPADRARRGRRLDRPRRNRARRRHAEGVVCNATHGRGAADVGFERGRQVGGRPSGDGRSHCGLPHRDGQARHDSAGRGRGDLQPGRTPGRGCRTGHGDLEHWPTTASRDPLGTRDRRIVQPRRPAVRGRERHEAHRTRLGLEDRRPLLAELPPRPPRSWHEVVIPNPYPTLSLPPTDTQGGYGSSLGSGPGPAFELQPSAKFSSDGGLVATWGRPNQGAQLWQPFGTRELARLRKTSSASDERLLPATVSADGRLVAAATRTTRSASGTRVTACVSRPSAAARCTSPRSPSMRPATSWRPRASTSRSVFGASPTAPSCTGSVGTPAKSAPSPSARTAS